MKTRRLEIPIEAKAGLWYTISNFFVKGIGFLTIPIFTRLLTTEDYGIVALFVSWVSLFSIFIGLSLRESIRRAKYEFGNIYDEFVSSITFLSLVIFLIYLIVFLIFNDFFLSFTGLSKHFFYLMIFVAFFRYIHELAMTKFRYEYKYKIVSLTNILMTILGVSSAIFLIIFIFNDNRFYGKIIGTNAIFIFSGAFFLVYIIVKGKKVINFRHWRYALLLSIPLIFHQLSLIINTQFDRILINRYLGASETGIYSFAYQVGMIIQVLFISLDQAWNPWFYQKYKEEKFNLIKDKAKKLRDLFSVMYFMFLMIVPELVRLMANDSFWEGVYVIPWIAMGYYFTFMYALEVNIEYAHKKTGLISIGTILTAIINITLNIIFIPKYGYIAAAITTSLSYFLLFIFHYLVTTQVLKISVYGSKFHITSLIYVTISTSLFIVFEQQILVRYGAAAFIFILFILTHKKEVLNL